MKKFFSFTVVLLAALCFVGGAFAADIDKNVLTYSIPNSATSNLVTNINITNETSGIVPGKHRILGFEVSAYAGAGIATASLLDTTSTSTSIAYTNAGGLFAEASAPVAGGSVYRQFPYPKALSSGLTVSQSNATIVNIYYERVSP